MASGLSAHLFAAVISIGSSSSQKMHLNSVRPHELVIGTILFPQCKQRVTLSIASPPRSSLCLCTLNSGTELSFLHFMFTFDSSKGEEQCRPLSIG